MSWIDEIEIDEADGRLAEIYKELVEKRGKVSNILVGSERQIADMLKRTDIDNSTESRRSSARWPSTDRRRRAARAGTPARRHRRPMLTVRPRRTPDLTLRGPAAAQRHPIVRSPSPWFRCVRRARPTGRQAWRRVFCPHRVRSASTLSGRWGPCRP